MNIPTEYLYPTQAAMEQWTDQRVIEASDLESLILFCVYWPKVASQLGYRYRGFGCRQKDGQTLLHVKVTEGGTPLVVFVTSATTTGCITRFWDLLEDDRLVWRKDKFA